MITPSTCESSIAADSNRSSRLLCVVTILSSVLINTQQKNFLSTAAAALLAGHAHT